MRKFNYKSDFDFILNLTDVQDNAIGFPAFNWTLNVFTKVDKNKVCTASSTDGELINCANDNGRLHIACDNHGLGKGNLYGEFYAEIPNDIYDDGTQLVVVPIVLGITLVDAASDGEGEMEVDVSLPVSLTGVSGE